MGKKVHLLDYVAGNIRSLVNAIEKCGYEVEWIRSPEDVKDAEKLILPGVGHFSHCLTSLSNANYLPAIHAHLASGKPFFGICVGLQALFSGSDEAPGVAGLGVIDGQLRRFDETKTSATNARGAVKARKSVPCIGWNSASLAPAVDSASTSRQSFYGLEDWRKYYYVHSYFAPYGPGCELEKQGWTVATARYGDETYAGAIGKGNVFATQFHPEKSGEAGLKVIKAFLEGRTWEDVSTPAIANGTQAPQAVKVESSTNGLTRRIIACLDVRTNDDGDLVVTKGDQYDVREKASVPTTNTSSSFPTSTTKHLAGQVRNLGKPVHLAEKYYRQSADEITFLNITSFRSSPLTDLPMLEILRQVSRTVFVPLTIGGGIRDTIDPSTGRTASALEVAKLYFASGADKVSIGSEAVTAAEEYYAAGGQLSGKTAIETISAAYGCQAVVVSVDPKRVFVDPPESTTPQHQQQHHTLRTALPDPATGREWVWYQCTTRGGRQRHDLDVIQLVTAVEAMGAGEILLNAIDRDGSNRGFDLELINAVKDAVAIPVVASSGAGRPQHFEEVFSRTGADAALGAGIFHRAEYTVGEVKDWLEGRAGMVVRRD